MIVDSHAHLGSCRVYDLDVSEKALLQAMDDHGIAATIVMPLPGAPDCAAVHDAIAALAKEHPGRVYGVASLNPHVEEDAYFAEVARCVRDLGFVGIKLHPAGHACSPTARDAAKAFDAARAFDIPLIVHTGAGLPFALPSLVIPRALEYPEVNIVLAHAGAHMFTAEAQIAASLCPNIYLETSWCGPRRIRDLVSALGAHRVMFGSDLPPNVATELTKYRTCGLSAAALEACLGETARTVFGLAH